MTSSVASAINSASLIDRLDTCYGAVARRLHARDFNRGRSVDSADYILWRITLGAGVPALSAADGDRNGVVDPGDYDVWRANFRYTINSGGIWLAGKRCSVIGEMIEMGRRTNSSC